MTTNNSDTNLVADVVLVGAGMVGATAALGLAQAGFQVVLLETALPPRLEVDAPPDLRVSAISQASASLFERLGVWQAMRGFRSAAYSKMHVWDAQNGASLDFDADSIESEHLGHIIENRVIQQCLLDGIDENANVTLIEGGKWCSVVPGASEVVLTLEDGRRLHARLLLAADGANSRLRERMGIQVQRKDYVQSGVVATVNTEHGHGDTAWQRFLPGGPLALLPLFDGQCSIVWSAQAAEAERLCGLDDEAFCRQLTQASEGRLGKIVSSSRRAAFPLRLQQAESYIAPRFALLGDAAHVVHPLAGQGVNLGLGDAGAMVERLIEARRQGRDIGGERCLAAWQRQRRGVDTLMGKAFDAIKHVFARSDELSRTARFLGIQALDRSMLAKKLLMKVAMGGRVSR